MRTSLLAVLAVLLWTGETAYGDAVVQVSVNTSSIAGTTGSLDFQFNFGNGATQSAAVQILNFTGGTYGGSSSKTGEVTGGVLPAPVTIGNGLQSMPNSGLNDYFQTFTYGNLITFTLAFSGPAVTAPDGQSTGNSKFYFSLFSDTSGLNPVLTPDPNGVAGTVTVNPNGSLTAAAISPNLQFVVPEPASLWLVCTILPVFAGIRSIRRRRSD